MMMRVTVAVFAMRMMSMLLMKKLRRWRYLARHGNASAVLQILVILGRLHVHLVLLAGHLRHRRLADVAAVVNVDLPAQVTMCEALEKKKQRTKSPVRIRDPFVLSG